ncbi:hypothetical protein SAMN05421823_104276 [Catalinimonas alkaloidigena]|uniref:Cellulase (Glycosyl hydrolase family 5) n=2 Tax=Catalinimonas alkaloidigena TaxID=1075417 RepID=A0A1G9H1A2_9BACT|nr:hypothetical protein SAMN05421823_104276 [Catalinimonas alkaloidigena]
MRWGDTKKEVQGFGVNYTVPFAYAYRAADRLGVDREQAIAQDVYHLARLGFDLYRVHVWDVEISDTVGNLLDNDHLRLLDFTLNELKKRGMHYFLTPIAYWPNGYPEPAEPTPGFATKYGKEACLTHPEAIAAQERYLFQFLNHVNPYTGVAYKDDPDLIAFEVSNEPHHRGTPEEVTAFINRMVASMRRTGCRKPIFYNISHSIHLADAYAEADIQGGTFQWYPTGLGARHELRGNLLPHVDAYTIPFIDRPAYRKMAQVVYEFDAADVGRSYIYPAMARSFRTAGMQTATHFAYDPTFLAHTNTEYSTHFMNLVYAPQKALSLMLAGEIFHRVPRHASYGTYPADTAFAGFRVSYGQDLAELVTDQKFIYTHHTTSAPKRLQKLEQIAGWGRSPLVQYDGTGAYFLDRLEKGVWRLEVLPDAVWVDDPFSATGLQKTVAVTRAQDRSLTVQLPDLGEGYTLMPLNEGNSYQTQAEGSTCTVRPGTYLLTRQGKQAKWKATDRWKNITLGEFYGPSSPLTQTYVRHTHTPPVSAGQPVELDVQVVAPETPDAVELWASTQGWRPEKIKMTPQGAYRYRAVLPADQVREGFLRYYITVQCQGQARTYPNDQAGAPTDWDFDRSSSYRLSVVAPNAGTPVAGTPVTLFNPLEDEAFLLHTNDASRYQLLPGAGPTPPTLQLRLPSQQPLDPENPEAEPITDHSFRLFVGDKVARRAAELSTQTHLVVRGNSGSSAHCPVQVALVLNDGSVYGATLTLSSATEAHRVALADLQPVALVTLPRPYPTFLPYYFENPAPIPFDLHAVESVQFSIDPSASAQTQPSTLTLEGIWLE